MKKVLAFVGIAVLMTSVAAAEVNPEKGKALTEGVSTTRANGVITSVDITVFQSGALEATLDATATTVGGDGVPVTVSFNGNTYVLDNQIWLYGQIYDSPWNGGCTFWTTSPGTDWCAYGEEYFINSPVALNNFAVSFTTTVPQPDFYQTFVVARGGLTWITTGFYWFSFSQTVSAAVVDTIYIDSTQPPTPTPSGAGEPVPALSGLGIIAMIAILAGVAILVMYGRKQ